MRLQSQGTGTSSVDRNVFEGGVSATLADGLPAAGAYDLSVTSSRARTLSLNRPASYLLSSRLHFPTNATDDAMIIRPEISATPSASPQPSPISVSAAEIVQPVAVIRAEKRSQPAPSPLQSKAPVHASGLLHSNDCFNYCSASLLMYFLYLICFRKSKHE